MNWPIQSPAQRMSLMVGEVVGGDLVVKESLVLLQISPPHAHIHTHTYTRTHLHTHTCARMHSLAPPHTVQPHIHCKSMAAHAQMQGECGQASHAALVVLTSLVGYLGFLRLPRVPKGLHGHGKGLFSFGRAPSEAARAPSTPGSGYPDIREHACLGQRGPVLGAPAARANPFPPTPHTPCRLRGGSRT